MQMVELSIFFSSWRMLTIPYKISCLLLLIHFYPHVPLPISVPSLSATIVMCLMCIFLLYLFFQNVYCFVYIFYLKQVILC